MPEDSRRQVEPMAPAHASARAGAELRKAQVKVKRLNKEVEHLQRQYDASRTLTGLKRLAAARSYRDSARAEVSFWLTLAQEL